MPDSARAREKYARFADTYDQGRDRPEPTRLAAVARLELAPGQTVLDMGCGTGLSLPLLEEAIGPKGRIVGIDLSPEMLAHARARVARQQWRNVTLVPAAAGEQEMPVDADAALLYLTHDIMRTPRAVAWVVQHLKPGGHVVAVGIQWAPWWQFRVNWRIWGLARSYTTTSEGLRAPWSHLAALLPNLRVETVWKGGMYLAWGTKVP
jgi:ubiquinone/menaquinone biosynthesis C-methylase UbiE